jgi:hypothetical protein
VTLLGPHQRCDAIASSQQHQPRFAVEEAQPISRTPSPRKQGTRQRVQERRRVPRDQIAVTDPVARSQRVTGARHPCVLSVTDVRAKTAGKRVVTVTNLRRLYDI